MISSARQTREDGTDTKATRKDGDHGTIHNIVTTTYNVSVIPIYTPLILRIVLSLHSFVKQDICLVRTSLDDMCVWIRMSDCYMWSGWLCTYHNIIDCMLRNLAVVAVHPILLSSSL